MAAAPQRSPLGCTASAPDKPAAPFVAWCAERRVLWPKCAVADLPATGRGVAATADIAAGEVVVEVPDDAVLMAESCAIAEALAADGLVKECAEDALLEVQGLVLAVMAERRAGGASRWGPYLALLPDDMTHMPIYWEDAELAELRGTAAHDKMVGRVQHPADAPTRVAQLFEELVLPFVQAHADVCQALLGKAPGDVDESEAREALWPLYRWATCAVASYSFVLGDDQYHAMVPVWDLLNHVTGAANVRLHHDAERGALQMIATAAIPAGAEVVNCYGALSNAEARRAGGAPLPPASGRAHGQRRHSAAHVRAPPTPPPPPLPPPPQLLRGYGYVEAHNPLRHVQVPAQFLIRAAAGAAGQASGDGGGSGPADAGAGAADDGAGSKRASGSGSEEGSDSGDEGSDEGEEGSGSEEEEPDWDLEDDEPSAGAPAPSLAAAQAQLADWEDRWQLCFNCKLLPSNGVFQVPAGGLAALPAALLPALLVLLASADDCAALAEAAAAATSKAKAAAAAAAAPPARRDKRGGKGAKQAKGKAAKGAPGAAPPTRRPPSWRRPLEDDEARVAQAEAGQLPPRLAAAVLARVGEKRVLRELAQALAQPGAERQLAAQARQALAAALQQLVAAAAAGPPGGGCGVAGCSHEHDSHCGRGGGKKRRAPAGSGSDSDGGGGGGEGPPAAAAGQRPPRAGRAKAATAAEPAEAAEAAEAGGASSKAGGGFAFNFAL
ncbi:SETD6 [Scenedesmus sp. PABB004]|nr:SETD6 [Scenedesmus sp. PABB004]